MAVVNDIRKLECEGYTPDQAIEIVKAKELRDIKELGVAINEVLTCLSLDMGLIRYELVELFRKLTDTPEEQQEEAMREMLRRLGLGDNEDV